MRLGLEQKEHLFHELAALLHSGKSLGEAFEVLGRSRGRLGAFAGRLGKVESIDGLVAASEGNLSSLDAAALEAGSASGKLEEVCTQLSRHYGLLHATRKATRRHLAYPIFILHFAAVVLSAPDLFGEGGIELFLTRVVATLAAFYVVGALLAAAWFGSIALARRSPGYERFLLHFPLFGGIWQDLAAGRFAMTLSLSVGAGIGILSALPKAGTSSGSAGIRGWSEEAVPRVRRGGVLSQVFRDCPVFPEEIDRAILSGEASGRIDVELERAANRLMERGESRLELLAVWFPRLTYVAILIVVLLRVLEVLGSYRDLLNQLLNF